MKNCKSNESWNLSRVCRETGLSRKVLTKMPKELPFFEINTGTRTLRRYKPQDVHDFIERNTKRA